MADLKLTELKLPQESRVNKFAKELGMKRVQVLADGTRMPEDFRVTPEGGLVNTKQFETLDKQVDQIMGHVFPNPTPGNKEQIAAAHDAFTRAQLILSYSDGNPNVFPFSKKLEEFFDPRVSRAMVALLSKNMAQAAEQPGAERRWVIDPKDLDQLRLPSRLGTGLLDAMNQMGFAKTAGGTDVAVMSGVTFLTRIIHTQSTGKLLYP